MTLLEQAEASRRQVDNRASWGMLEHLKDRKLTIYPMNE